MCKRVLNLQYNWIIKDHKVRWDQMSCQACSSSAANDNSLEVMTIVSQQWCTQNNTTTLPQHTSSFINMIKELHIVLLTEVGN